MIGSVDPQSMTETDEGLVVEGQLDLETSEVAREAWRSMKAGRIALSFGYLVTHDFKREDGVRELLGIDLFEISLTPSPANPDTRVVSMKSASLDTVLGNFYGGVKQQDRDRELKKLIAKVQTEAAKEANRNRPIKIAKFEV